MRSQVKGLAGLLSVPFILLVFLPSDTRCQTSHTGHTAQRGTRRYSSRCTACTVNGRQYAGHSRFSFEDGCLQYNCVCRCDGSYDCPSRHTRRVCNDKTGKESSSSSATSSSNAGSSSSRVRGNRRRCSNCVVDGKEYRGHSYFTHERGCTRWESCICRCNGSWECPKERARSICDDGASSGGRRTGSGGHNSKSGSSSSSSGSTSKQSGGNGRNPSSRNSCKTCTAGGIERKGNSYFELEEKCTTYRYCVCRCNGSWSCPERFAKNTCKTDPNIGKATRRPIMKTTPKPVVVTRPINNQCTACFVAGKSFKGNSYFRVRDGCIEYSDCLCRCNGSWACPGSRAKNVCYDGNYVTMIPTTYTGNQRGRCSTCKVNNEVIKGNSYFNLTDKCIQYERCICSCDGSWNCPPEFAKNLCRDRGRGNKNRNTCSTCNAKGKIIAGGTKFDLTDRCISYWDCECRCNGSWECFGDKARDICRINSIMTGRGSGCKTCKAVDGSLHRPNRPFSIVKDCVEYNCDCNCDGSWKCPSERSRWVCTDKCLGCDVEGRKIASNSTFNHKTGCLEYTCDCFCNGSWSCPGRTARNTCPVGVNVNCNKCIVSPREQYEGETDFVLRQDCLHYKCRCNCDGSYSCPGKDARNVCRGERLGGCRSCVVSEREFFKGDTDFSFRKGCISYQCRCNCDGSWSCPAKDARDVCLGEVPGGCRVCRVSDTEIYRPNTQFDLRKGCIHYKCQCNCDGGWKCPGKDARDVCKGEVPGGCRSCMISENEFYPGNSNFEMVKNCIHYKCRCHCNGGYNCPGETAKRVCKAKDGDLPPTCSQCVVSDTEKFQGNSSFSIERGCNRYQCDCKCDGSWECSASKTTNICRRETKTNVRARRKPCKPCKIGKEIVPGNSRFKFNRRCFQVDCRCNCTGEWSCDHLNPVDICEIQRQLQSKPSIISGAEVVQRADLSSENSTYTSETGVGFVETDISSDIGENTTDTNKNSTIVTDRESSYVKNTYFTTSSVLVNQDYGGNNKTNFTDFTTDEDGNSTDSIDRIIDEAYNETRHGDNSIDSTSNGRVAFKNNCKRCLGDRGFTKEVNELFSYRTRCLHYERCKCLCSGEWDCSKITDTCKKATSSSSTSSSHSSSGRTGNIIPISGSVSTTYEGQGQTSSGRVNQETVVSKAKVELGGKDTKQVKKVKGKSGSDYEITIDVDYSSTSRVEGRRDGTVRHIGTVDELYKGSSSSSSSSSSSYHGDSSSSSLSPSRTSHAGSKTVSSSSKGGCRRCIVDGREYRAGANFDWRRGCVLYKCTCSCSGSHRCRVTSDNACTNSQRQNSCRNCVYKGLVYPGNMAFTVTEGCYEKKCDCHCNGTYKCQNPSYVQGCGGNRLSPGGRYPPSSSVYTVNKREGSASKVTKTQKVTKITNRQGGLCRGCTIEGQQRPGNSSFTFRKGCVEFDCFCACSGSWKCSSRQSQLCAGRNVPTRTQRCQKCDVKGTTYPYNSTFLLREGCFEYMCSCNCNGSWSCPSQKPINKCSVNGQSQISGYDFTKRTRVLSGNIPSRIGDDSDRWSGLSHERTCRECNLDGQVFIPEKDFQFLRGRCYLYNCHCYCNGSYSCPSNDIKNICKDIKGIHNDKDGVSVQVERPIVDVDESGEPVRNGDIPGCQRCVMHGQQVEPLGMFIKRGGCFETLCHCQCNGEPSCPKSASVNVCELPDKKPIGQRPGCKVGRRTHFTRVFGLVQDCYQRICICHDNGTWNCRRSPSDKKVC